jgi:hypothetical protein
MPVTRSRSGADIRRDLKATEHRLNVLVDRWRSAALSDQVPADDAPSREFLDKTEELLRHQRGAIDRLHQLWIEWAQSSGQHAPQ